MKTFVVLICLAIPFLSSCSKDDDNEVVNGVNVDLAVNSFNTYRTQGHMGYPAVSAANWSPQLSTAAYNFAKAKAEDPNPIADNYELSSGARIFNYPAMAGFSGSVTMALYMAFPSTTSVSEVLHASFSDPAVVAALMSPSETRFGIGQYGDRWYLMMAP